MKDFFETIFLLAAVQGFLLTLILITKRNNRTANRILAFATFSLSIDLVSALYYSKGWYVQAPYFMGISYPFAFLYGPLFYLYARFVSKSEQRFQKTDWLHFLPVVIIYLFCIPEFLYPAEQKIEFVNNMMHGIHALKFGIIEGIIPVQGIFYTLWTITIVREYNHRIRNSFSNIDLINLNWLTYVTLGMILIWSLVAVLYIIRIIIPVQQGVNVALQVSISVLIYFIGYKGLQQPEIFFPSSEVHSENSESEKYKRSGLSDGLAEDIKQKLVLCMTSEKLFLDNELTMQRLAERMNISNHNLSEVINSKMNTSYYDFINHHRVEEFKRRIADPANDPFNLLSIAFDSGFKSKGTFNSIFKKFTGMTPSEYKSTLAVKTRT